MWKRRAISPKEGRERYGESNYCWFPSKHIRGLSLIVCQASAQAAASISSSPRCHIIARNICQVPEHILALHADYSQALSLFRHGAAQRLWRDFSQERRARAPLVAERVLPRAELSPNLPSSSISFVWRGFVLLVSSLYRVYVAEGRAEGKAFKWFCFW